MHRHRRAGRRREHHGGAVHVYLADGPGNRAGAHLAGSRAESTRENLQFSLALIEEKTGRRPREIAVVSSEYHLFRASCMARSQGVSMLGVPAATYPPALRVHYAFREIFGLWLFLLLGR